MKIRTLRNQLIDMTEKEVTTVLTPTGSYQILAHTKDKKKGTILGEYSTCLLYTSPSPRDGLLSRMPSSA